MAFEQLPAEHKTIPQLLYVPHKDYLGGREGELIGLQIKLERFFYSYQAAAITQLFQYYNQEKHHVTDTMLKSPYPCRDRGCPQLHPPGKRGPFLVFVSRKAGPPHCWALGQWQREQHSPGTLRAGEVFPATGRGSTCHWKTRPGKLLSQVTEGL